MTTFSIPQHEATKLSKALTCCMSSDKLRPWLGGVCLDYDGVELNAVSLDGHRAAMLKIHPVFMADNPAPFKFVIPADAVKWLNLPNTREEDALVSFEVDDTSVTLTASPQQSRAVFTLVESLFPEWQRFVPHSHTSQLALNAKLLGGICNAVCKVTSSRTNHGIQIEFEDPSKVLIRTHDEDLTYVIMGIRF